MQFRRLVECSHRLAETSSRTSKSMALAELLSELDASEVAPAIGLLVGQPRQGRIGVGWATVTRLDIEPAADPTLTIADVDRLLEELSDTTGPGSSKRRNELLARYLGRATTAELDYVRQLFTGGVRHGALAGVVVDAVARAADVRATAVRRANMLAGDLGVAAVAALTGGERALAAIGLTLGRPIQPMLAASAESVSDGIDELGEVAVEWKLDGVRVQIHRWGDEVAVFTRNLNDITDRLPEVVALAAELPARSFIADGEVIVLSADGRPEAFQDTMSRVGQIEPGAAPLAVATFLFDLMHHDGADLIDEPWSERHRILAELAGPHLVPGVVSPELGAAERTLEEALAAGHEGVVLKAVGSTYQAGRRGKAWRKVKPVHTLDLVVLAAEWGHGRRRGWLSNLHLGARGPDGELVMVGKTFKGLTDALLRWQTDRLQELAVRRTGHTVFVRPELVVEIALDGAQASTTYPGGVALRFARVRQYRPDKNVADADSLDAVRALLHEHR